MDAFSLGTDVNLGAAGYSGEYQPVFRIDALNTEAGVSVNNLATGKSGTTVRYLLEPVTPAKKGMVSFRKDADGSAGIQAAQPAIWCLAPEAGLIG